MAIFMLPKKKFTHSACKIHPFDNQEKASKNKCPFFVEIPSLRNAAEGHPIANNDRRDYAIVLEYRNLKIHQIYF